MWLLRRATSFAVRAMMKVGKAMTPGIASDAAARLVERPAAAAGLSSNAAASDDDAAAREHMEPGFDAKLYKELNFRGSNCWTQLRACVTKYDVDLGGPVPGC